LKLRRVPALYWILSLALAACTSVTIFRLAAAADSRARYWGTMAAVPVVTEPIAAGATVEPAHFEIRRVPESLLPHSAVEFEPAGLTAIVPMWPGEVLVEAKLAPAGLDGPAAMLQTGERAVAVPRSETTPPLSPGDRVDVILNLDPSVTGGGPPAIPVARAVRVLHLTEAAVTLAVPAEDAAKVAFGAAQGALSLAIAGPADWTSGPGGGHREDHRTGEDPVDHEGSEAAVADETQQPPDGGEPGDGGRADAHPESPAEPRRDPAGAE
jgi:Flp pilus assembly protein CpaB